MTDVVTNAASNVESNAAPAMPPEQEAAALLASLRDIHLPETSGLSFAPAWVLLGAGLFLLMVLLLIFFLRRRGFADWRQVAQQELAAIRNRRGELPPNETLSACSRLLRRASLALSPRDQVAAVTGDAWLHTLDELHRSHQFTRGPGSLLLEEPYRQPRVDDATLEDKVERLIPLVQDFIDTAERR